MSGVRVMRYEKRRKKLKKRSELLVKFNLLVMVNADIKVKIKLTAV